MDNEKNNEEPRDTDPDELSLVKNDEIIQLLTDVMLRVKTLEELLFKQDVIKESDFTNALLEMMARLKEHSENSLEKTK